MNRALEPDAEIAGLRRALPYLRLYRGRTFIVKVGGEAAEDPGVVQEVAEQIGVLRELGIKVVLVHGAGPQATMVARRLGIETSFVAGRRVTSRETLEAVTMALVGTVATAWMAAFRKLEVPALGFSGISSGVLRARKRPPVEVEEAGERQTVDYGQVGDLRSVDPAPLFRLLETGFVPVMSPLAADDQGQVLNINADTVAAKVAEALGAEKLIFLTGAPGLLEDLADPSSVVSVADLEGIRQRVADGTIRGGMLPKVQAASEALQRGVRRVHIVGHGQPLGLLREVFTNAGAGTLLVRSLGELMPEEGPEGPGGAR